MATFILIPGAGSDSWYWHLVVPELERRGHDVVAVQLLVLVAAMVPKPGESAGEWWTATGQEDAQREMAERDGRKPGMDDIEELFLHDVPAEVAAAGEAHVRMQSGTP